MREILEGNSMMNVLLTISSRGRGRGWGGRIDIYMDATYADKIIRISEVRP